MVGCMISAQKMLAQEIGKLELAGLEQVMPVAGSQAAWAL
jgi:hypothetical protein